MESFRAKSQTAMRMGKLQKHIRDNQLIYLTNNEIAETHIFFKKIPDKKKYSDILMFMSAMFISNPKGK